MRYSSPVAGCLGAAQDAGSADSAGQGLGEGADAVCGVGGAAQGAGAVFGGRDTSGWAGWDGRRTKLGAVWSMLQRLRTTPAPGCRP